MAKLVITIEVPMEHVDAEWFEAADEKAQAETVADYIRLMGLTRDWSCYWKLDRQRKFNPWRLIGEPDYIASDFVH